MKNWEMGPSMCNPSQRIGIKSSIYEAILEEKLDNKSQKKRKLCFPERRGKAP